MNHLEEIIAIIGAIIASTVVVFNWRATRFRGKLKDDLDILKKYREELLAQGMTSEHVLLSEHYGALQASINRNIVRAYIYKGTDISDLVIAIACLLLGAFILFDDKLLQPEFRIASFVAFSALGTVFVIKSIHDRREPRSR